MRLLSRYRKTRDKKQKRTQEEKKIQILQSHVVVKELGREIGDAVEGQIPKT